MNRKQKLQALRAVLGHEEYQKGDECIFFCPRHGHHKAKLSVNLKTDYHNCWICGFSGTNLKPLLYFRGRNDQADEYSRSIDGRHAKADSERYGRAFDAPVLPSDFLSLSSKGDASPYRSHALRYLQDRGVSLSTILRYKLGYCTEGPYRGRIIIPSFDSGGDLNFFVGRKFYDWAGLSYKHGNFDKNVIFNDYLVDWDEPVTLVEGPFDAFIADNSVPLQGTILRDDSLLFAKIITSQVPVYLALDSDARAKQMGLMGLFMGYGVPVGLIEVEKHGAADVGEMTHEQFQHAKHTASWVHNEIQALRIRARA